MTLDDFVSGHLDKLPGWMWTAYGGSEHMRPRFVLVSPDYRTQIGREADTTHAAMMLAIHAALNGEKQ